MASALFTLADGAAAAVAVGGSAQPVGLNVTAGNTVTGQLSDMTGVTGYTARTIWNSANLSDFTFSQANFTINQTTGAWSFPAGSVEGVAYVVEVAILNSTLVPTVTRSYVGVYVSAQGGARVAFPSTAQTPNQLIALMSTAGSLPNTDPNAAFILNAATTNGQGSGGPTIVALVSLVCKASGIFDWSISAAQPAAAATEVVTWTATSQTGAAALAFTGNTAVGQGGQVGTAAAGTGIVVSTGGGGELTVAAPVTTVGTAAVGAFFAAQGTLHNVAGGTVLTPFARGNNVLLLLKITNSATNRVVSSINMTLRERLFE
jgi:hypothetical protein